MLSIDTKKLLWLIIGMHISSSLSLPWVTVTFGSPLHAVSSGSPLSKNLISACPICLEITALISLHCHHTSCRSCLKKLIHHAYSTTTITDLRCPHLHCRIPLTYDDFLAITHSPKILALVDALLLEPITIPSPAYPDDTGNTRVHTDAHPLFITPLKQRNRFKEWLHLLIERYLHRQIKRTEKKQRTLHHQIEIKYNKQWIQSHTRACPHCHVPIEKITGCNYVYCTHCFLSFCWDCAGNCCPLPANHIARCLLPPPSSFFNHSYTHP